jgi:serine/threonine protein kinase
VFLVTEFIESVNLHTALSMQQPTLSEIVALGKALASATSAIHALGFIHRDIKPKNILIPIAEAGLSFQDAQVVDLACCAALSEASPRNPSHTPPGRWSGTADYMPPEQILGRCQSAASDVFGIAATLFECIYSRSIAWRSPRMIGCDVQTAIGTIYREIPVGRLTIDIEIPDSPKVGDKITSVLETALRADASKRQQSSLELLLALSDCTVAESPCVSEPES